MSSVQHCMRLSAHQALYAMFMFQTDLIATVHLCQRVLSVICRPCVGVGVGQRCRTVGPAHVSLEMSTSCLNNQPIYRLTVHLVRNDSRCMIYSLDICSCAGFMGSQLPNRK